MSAYFYTNTNPHAAVYKHFKLLNDIKLKNFTDLVTVCCLPGQRNVKLELFEAIAMRNGAEVKQLQTACHTLDSVLTNMIDKLLTVNQIEQDLSSLGLPREKIDVITRCCSSLIGSDADADTPSPVCKIPTNQLVDMEWKFGVTAASSELDKVGATFLRLQLKVCNSSGELDTLNMELSLSQFYNFLHELEKANTSLDYM